MKFSARLAALLLAAAPVLSAQTATYADGDSLSVARTTAVPLHLTIALGSASESGVISGSGNVFKDGNGTLILSGANTYSGATTLRGGTLGLASSGALGSTTAIYFNGGSLQFSPDNTTDYSNRFVVDNGQLYSIDTNGQSVTLSRPLDSPNGSLTKSGLGALTLSGANTYAGGTNVNAGILALGASDRLADTGPVTVNGGTFEVRIYNETVGAVSLLSGAITSSTGILTGSAYNLQSGSISAILGGSAALIKSGLGVVTLSGANTYTGTTTITAGALVFANAPALPPGRTTANFIVQSGATAGFSVGGAGGFTSSDLLALSQFSSATGGFTSGSLLGLDTGGNAFTLTEAIGNSNGGANILGLAKLGAGTLTLAANNTYTGHTTIIAGTLALGAAERLANTNTLSVDGGTFDLSSFNETIDAIILNSGSITGSGTLTVASSVTVSEGVISATLAGSTRLDKMGTGNVTLSGNNTYIGGTIIYGGTLTIASVGALGSTGQITLAGGDIAFAEGVYVDYGTRLVNAGTTPPHRRTFNFDSITLTESGNFPGGIVKRGTGKLRVTGAFEDFGKYYSQTRVEQGTLEIVRDLSLFADPTTAGYGFNSYVVMRPNTTLIVTTIDDTIYHRGLEGDGSTAFIKRGPGTMIYRANNSVVGRYSGSVTIEEGTLQMGYLPGSVNPGLMQAATGGYPLSLDTYGRPLAAILTEGDIVNNATLRFSNGYESLTYGGKVSGPGQLIQEGRLLTLTGTHTYTGGTTITAGTQLTLGGAGSIVGSVVNNGTLELASSTLSNLTALTGSGNLLLTSGTFQIADSISAPVIGSLTNNATLQITTGNPLTISGNVAGGGNLSKTGTGTLTFAGNYAPSGGLTTISAGLVTFAGNYAPTGGLTTISSGSVVFPKAPATTLTATNFTLQPNAMASFIVGATGGITSANIATIADVGSATGGFTSGSTLALDTSQAVGGNFTLAHTLSNPNGGANVRNLRKLGAGTLTISAPQTYTGTTTISAGTLTFSASEMLPNNQAIVVNGGTLQIGNFTETVGTVTLAGGTITSTGTGSLLPSSYVFQGGSLGFGITGSIPVNKTTTGLLSLSGTNTYTGTTTVSAGTLVFDKKVSLYNNTPANWTASKLIVESGAAAAFKIGGTGEFTVTDFTTLAALGTATGGFKNGSSIGFDYSGLMAASLPGGLGNPNGGANALGLTKLGTGTLALYGTNTYTGATTVLGGELILAERTVLRNGAITGLTAQTFAVGAGASARFYLGSNSPTEFTQAEIAHLTALTSATGGFMPGSTLILDTIFTPPVSGYDPTALNDPYAAYNPVNVTNYGRVDLAGIGGGSGVGLKKTGRATLVLGGTTAYTGPTLVEQGILAFRKRNTGQTWAAGSLTVNHAASVYFNVGGTGEFTPTDVTAIAAIPSVGTAFTPVISGFEGGSILGLDTTNATGGTFAFTGTINLAGGTDRTHHFAKLGTGALVLSGLNYFGWVTLIDPINGPTNLPTSVRIFGGTLRFAQRSSLIHATSGNLPDIVVRPASTLAFNVGGASEFTSADITSVAAAAFFNENSSLALDTTNAGAGGFTFTGALGGSAVNFTKLGTGTLTLSGAHTYSGTTTISAGTLSVNGSLGNTGVSVTSGTTLGGTGTLGGLVTVASGAHLAPGASAGTLTLTAGLTLATGAVLDFEIGGTSDKVVVGGGALTGPSGTGGITLNLTDLGGLTPGAYPLIDFSAVGTTASNFEATDFTLGSTHASYTYSLAITGNQLVLRVAAAQTLTFSALAGKTYGDTAFTLGATASSGLTPTYTIVSGPATITGNTVTITGTGTVVVRASQAGNVAYFAATPVDQSFTVAKNTLTVTADAKTRGYGDANPALTATIAGFVNGETSALVSGAAALSTGATPTSSVGGYVITAGIGTLSTTNYDFSPVNGTLTVTKAPLIVTADPQTRTYGAANPPFTASFTGFKNSETSGVLTGAPALITTAILASGVADYPITAAVGTLASGNYSFGFVDGTLAVTKAPLTVTADNKNRGYGVADPVFTATITGFVNGDTTAAVGGAATFTTTATSTSALGGYPITPAAGTLNATNYAFTTFTPGTLTVGQTSQTLTFGALTGKTYGDVPFTVSATASSTLTPTYSIVSGPATITGSTVTITGAGTVIVRASQAGDVNYTAATPVDQSFAVAKASQTITFSALTGKTYGDADFALSATASSTLTPTYSLVSGPATISGSTITITGVGTVVVRAAQSGDANYEAATPVDQSFTVGKATATVALAGLTATYDGSAKSATATTTPASLTVEITYDASATAPTNAGSYAVVGTITDANYQGSASGTLVIAKASQAITFGALAGKTFGDAAFSLNATASSALPITFTIVSGPATISGATLTLTAAGTVVVRASQAGNANYNPATAVDQSFTAAKASQTLTFGALTGKTYGDAAFAVSATASSTLAATFSIVSGPATLSGSTVTITGAGTVTLRASQAGDANYNAATAVDQSFTVAKPVLTVTAEAANRIYGATNPAFTATITGFVNGETNAVLTGTAALTTTATTTSPVATYPITATTGTLAAANYDFAFNSGILTVTPATLTVTADAKTRTYGDANPTFTATITGFVNGETTTVVSGTAALSTSAAVTSNAASYAITAALGSLNAANYAFSFVNGTLTVTKAALTVTADNKNRAYGVADPTFTATITGFVNGDTSAVVGGAATFTTTATSTSPVGDYPITPAIGTLTASNYAATTFTPGTLTIGQTSQTITFGALAGKTYGDAAFTVSATASSSLTPTYSILSGPATITGNTVTITGTGTVVVRASQSGDANYTAATTVDQSFAVAKASQTLTFGALASKTYGDAAFTVSATTSSTLTPTYSLVSGPATISGSTVTITGTGTVVVGAAQSGDANYEAATPVDQSFTVGKATATVALAGLTATYDGSAKSATATTTPANLTVAITYDASATARTSAGSYAVLGTINDANYQGTASGTLVIAKASQTITFGALTGKTYGDAAFAVSATASSTFTPTYSIASGRATISGGTITITGAGTVVVRASQSGDANTNAATPVDQSFTVAKKVLTVAADAANRTYGAANPAFTATLSGFVNGETSAVLSGSAALSTTATTTSTVGDYAITAAVGTLSSANYSFTFADGTLAVTKAPLTVTADNATRAYGLANPAFTATITGFVNGDTAAAITGAATFTSTATLTSAAGTYPITPAVGTLTASNYAFTTFTPGVLTVGQASQTLTFAALAGKTYGDAAFTVNATATSGLTPTFTIVSGPATLTNNTLTLTGAGTVVVRATQAGDASYSAAASVDQSFTLAPAALTVTADNQTRIYGVANPALTVSYTGFVNGDTAAALVTVPVATTTATTTSNVGTYPITVTAGVSSSYTFTTVAGTLTVTTGSATVALTNLAATYDGTAKSASATTSPAGLTVSLTYNGSTTAPTDAGSYAVVATINSPNVTGSASGTLVIAKATQSVTFGALPTTVNVGTPISLSATASSGLPVAFSVVSGNASLSGASLTLNDTSPVVVRATQGGDANRNAASADASLSAALQNQTITFAALSAATTASGPITLAASSSSGLAVTFALVSGPATLSGSTLTLAGTTGTVVVRATQAGNAAFSAAPTVERSFTVTNATAAPIIVQAPSSRTLNVGQSTTLTVVAIGDGTLTYQWLKDGAVIANATATTLALSNVTTASAGAYRVDVTNAGGTTRSAAVTLTVNDAATVPVITAQPAPQTAQVGGSATFTVVATGNPAPTYQWRKNGTNIPGATTATLTLSNVQNLDAAGYDVVVSNTAGSVSSSFVPLTVNAVATAPVITRQPSNDTALVGSTVVISVAASGAPAPTYQWQKDGAVLPGATAATLTLTSVTKVQAGGYAVVVSNAVGSVTSRTAALTVLSHSYAGTYFGTLSGGGTFALYIRDDNTGVFLGFTAGATTAYASRDLTVDDDGRFTFTSSATTAASASPITGARFQGLSGEPSVLAVSELVFTGTISLDGNLSGSAGGITLGATKSVEGATQSVAGFYAASASGSSSQTLTIVSPSGQALVFVQTATGVDAGLGSVSATGAIAVTTASGQTVTASVSSTSESVSSTVTDKQGVVTTFTGTADGAASLGAQRLGNLSSRARVSTGEQVAIAGFVISGEESKAVLIRAVGPALTAFGVQGALAAPKLELYRAGTVIATNTGWTRATNAAEIGVAATRAGAFALAGDSVDSAVLVTLAPGAYSAVVSSAGGAGGVAMVEVYDLSGPAAGQKLINLSTRAFAGLASDTLIAGVVVNGTAPKRVLIRAAGPALTAFGISGALGKPKLELFSGSTVIAQNTGWSTSADATGIAQAATQVGAFAFTAGAGDSALLVNLAPGAYTAQVSGLTSATGVALIEIYEVP